MARDSLWTRLKRRRGVAADDASLDPAVKDYLSGWIGTHVGVESWVEAPAGINPASILLVALDGEWTRRSVPSVEWARDFAAKNDVTAYDAGLVAYPQRMRDYDTRRRRSQG